MKQKSKKNQKKFFLRLFLKLLPIIFMIQICVVSLSAETSDNKSDKKKENEYSVDLLMTPSSPAFVLLREAPTSILRPATGKQLAVTLLKNLSTIEGDFAIEFSPAWLFFGKKITFDNLRNNKNVLNNLIQTLSISIAKQSNASAKNSTTELDSKNDSISVSFGFQFSILRGKLKYEQELFNLLKQENLLFYWVEHKDPKLKKLRDSRIQATGRHKNEIDSEIGARKKYIEETIRGFIKTGEINDKEIKELFKEEFRDLRREMADKPVPVELSTIINQIQEKASEFNFNERIGWNLDIAGGTVYNFPGEKFKDGKLDRWGIWTTLGYELKNWNFLAVLRYLSKDDEGIKKNSIDIGSRIILNYKRFSASAEGIFRKFKKNTTDNNQWRAAILLEYKLFKNQSINFTFGRDFEGNKTNLISMIGLNINLGSTKLKIF